MDNIKTFLSRQWQLGARDWFISLFYAIIVPVLLQVQSVLDSGSINFNWVLIGQVALSAGVAHILRKLTNKTKVVTVQHIDKEEIPEAEYLVAKANKDKDTPPPIGDPTHPSRLFSDPPPIGDPTHPSDDGDEEQENPEGDPPPIGDPTHPPKK